MCPIIADLGYDMVWFGRVMIVAIETGMITLTFGMNVFTVKSSLHGMNIRKNERIYEDVRYKNSQRENCNCIN